MTQAARTGARLPLVLGAVALVAALGVGAWLLMTPREPAPVTAALPAPATTAPEPAPAVTAPPPAGEPVDLAARGYAVGDVVLGAPDAPVTVIEYASLTCPHCASFHMEAWPSIKARYVDTGKARFIFREVYFEQHGLWASMIARCGGEGPFHGYISTFLERQQEWARAQDVAAELMRLGRLGGLSAERMQACLTDADFMNRLVADYQANATEHNVRSTPTFIINGESHSGAMSAAQFSALLDKHL